MNARKLNTFKKSFANELATLLAMPNPEKVERSMTGDEADQVMENATTEANAAFVMRKNARINKVRQALRRIESGTFGECQQCEDEIEDRRLEANPVAERCISCQELSERTARQIAQASE
jgi:DnaK suppressor protein